MLADAAYERQINGDVTGAAKLYREALDADDGSALCWYNLGLAYHQLGQDREARTALLRATQLEPSNANYQAALKSVEQQ